MSINIETVATPKRPLAGLLRPRTRRPSTWAPRTVCLSLCSRTRLSAYLALVVVLVLSRLKRCWKPVPLSTLSTDCLSR